MKLDESWVTRTNVHGGYVLAEMLRPRWWDTGLEVLAITASFFASVGPGEAQMESRYLHRGRETSTLSRTLRQSRDRVYSVLKLGRLADGDMRIRATESPVAREGMAKNLVSARGPMPFDQHVRVEPVDLNPDSGVHAAWVQLCLDDQQAIHLTPQGVCLVLLDAVDPVLVRENESDFVATIEMSAHFAPASIRFARPGNWFYLEQRMEWSSERYCVEEMSLQSECGTRLANARQLRIH